ncbi:MAG: hypothetical protein A2161_05050 [Candidatus Schekmanbacteria bacterium RBG_13_48_7]|uniref:DUF885 domain-containing protein n=1 Tax=Candidatus Schekmanbacteria bacterium RBG_13_48_7 TaxID=1817878 RepID=A0A1F7RVZ3_9BACT|nr:MAG: hypothetical protein A2161_05050 [Candidatus Schekmanbacteria bacterium RBG_13_48_7]
MINIKCGQQENFYQLSETICNFVFKTYPIFATYNGVHDFDECINTLSKTELEQNHRQISKFIDTLTAFDESTLNVDSGVDHNLLLSFLKTQVLDYEIIRSFKTNPMIYTDTVSQGIFSLIRRRFAPLNKRFRSIIEREKFIPKILQSARENLDNPPAYITTKTIELTTGALSLFETILPKLASELTDNSLKRRFHEGNDIVILEIKKYLSFLEEELQPRSNGSYVLGEKIFSQLLFLTENVDIPVTELKKFGLRELRRLQNLFISTSQRMNSDCSPAENIESVLNDYLEPDQLIPYTASLVEKIKNFIIDRDIVTIPRDVTCTVEPMPSFLWGFAAMSTPGAFESKSTESFYYVEPVKDEWSEEHKREHLKALNKWTMESVSIHEAYPGHFIQGIYTRNLKSKVKKIFQSSAAHEGWAHYCEEMMVEEGYGNNDPRFLMGFLRECLIRVCRYHVAIGLHTGEMSVDDGIEFFKKEGYMDPYTAREETLRGIYDPLYLVYTLGKLLMFKIRNDYKNEKNGNYSLKMFHDEYLNVGPIALPLAKKLLLNKNNKYSLFQDFPVT